MTLYDVILRYRLTPAHMIKGMQKCRHNASCQHERQP
jgi:hypothetical protein